MKLMNSNEQSANRWIMMRIVKNREHHEQQCDHENWEAKLEISRSIIKVMMCMIQNHETG